MGFVKREDFRIDVDVEFMNVTKKENVKVTHIPSGVSATWGLSKSQLRNRNTAFKHAIRHEDFAIWLLEQMGIK